MLLRRRSGALAGLLLLTPSLVAVGPSPAGAAPAVPAPVATSATAPEESPPASSDRAVSASPVTAAATDGIETDTRTRPVAPGVELTSYDRFDANGWIRADALTADLTGGVTVDYVNSGAVARAEPLRAAVDRAGAVAAVNGDFFDINNSGAAQGIGIQSGVLVQSPVAGHHEAVGVTADGIGRVLQVYFDGTATLPTGPVTLTQFNNMVAPDGIGIFTPLWGSYPRSRAVAGASRVTEVALVGGRVSTVSDTAGSGPIPAGTTILLGRDAGADALAALRPGDPVDIRYAPRTSDGSTLRAAIGGNRVLVRDGVPQDIGDVNPEPRTAVGFSADGRKMFLVTVDGRQADSRGVTLTELGRMMAELGAHNALNLDGGGSSTLLAREPGQPVVQVENSPSDGSERPVPNGLALFAPQGSGRLRAFWVETVLDRMTAPGLGPIPGGRPERVFPGLTRRLSAAGYDETYGPAPGTPTWRSSPASGGTVDRDGVFRARRPGKVTVTAARGRARGELELTVLGPLARIDTTAERLGLAGVDATGTFGVVGYDADGNTAPIEPADLRLEYDHELFEITPTSTGHLSVRSKVGSGAGMVTVRVGDSSTVVPVTVGLTDVPVAMFDDAANWRFSAARATGSVAPAPGHTGTGLRLAYDFGQSTGTRAAYADPPAWIEVPGQPQAFGMWIYANGNGEWPSLHLHDALDQQHVLRGPYLDWTGWRYVEMPVPAGVVYPVRVRRFYVAETDAAAQYTGEIVIDDIVARVPPEITPPAEETRTDRVVVTDGTVDRAPWRFAVLSDAQFVAADPESDLVAQARRTLREIRAARPDFLVINGDFVDTAYPADFALAKRILDEELRGEVPYYYVPGNHEIMGAPITNFQAVFGATTRVFDHTPARGGRATRFITLDTSAGSLRASNFAQVRALRAALDGAAADPRIGSVVVLEHHPLRDPTPAKASQLGDRKEAALLERWLAEFQEETGKGTLFVGSHVGTFHADRVDGVPYVVNGNAGKNPSTAPHLGGFTGWTMFGVDPVSPAEAAQARRDPLVAGPRWVTAETRAHVDALAITAPARVRAGASVSVTATLTQPGGRQVPVAAPVSADWAGSATLHIGSASGLRPWHVAWFDPATGRLTGLRTGTVRLAVTVNGVRAEQTIVVTPRKG
ncbi:phosphodiester glycosidase family protein [Micromonospora sp. HM5-17]|uniref:phosphodiester glycosidase family protein n=1 Tax=Micromonospora sp. HM5-17 TaxID=2487710 RepID=UPI000F477A62|nr:phosphodiester glycosidase family protein [Micromonospora sp. HM5-17]ROT31583.1 multidrug transporter [Micromonospora sp. HM5-17]